MKELKKLKLSKFTSELQKGQYMNVLLVDYQYYTL